MDLRDRLIGDAIPSKHAAEMTRALAWSTPVCSPGSGSRLVESGGAPIWYLTVRG